MGFFSKLFNNLPEDNSLKPNEDDERFIQYQFLPQIAPETILQLPNHYSACFIQNGHRSRVFIRGDHNLDASTLTPLSPNQPLHLLYLCRQHSLQRDWKTRYISADNHDPILQLQGQYRVQLISESSFFDFLQDQTNLPNLETLDHWFSECVIALIAAHNIPTLDIISYPDRLALFLQDALVMPLKEIGLAPIQVVMQATPLADKPNHTTNSPLPPNNSAATVENQAVIAPPSQNTITETSPPNKQTVEPTPVLLPEDGVLEYYRIINCEQAGPFSAAHIQNLINQKKINGRTRIWKKGMPAWQPVAAFPEFQWTDN